MKVIMLFILLGIMGMVGVRMMEDLYVVSSLKDDTLISLGLEQEEGWREAYAELLRGYMGLSIEQFDIFFKDGGGKYFILHDINQDGIPELFIVMGNVHTKFYRIYTFSNGETIQLEFDKSEIGEISMLIPLNNNPWFILFRAVGSGGRYIRFRMDSNSVISDNVGFLFLNDIGINKLSEGKIIDISYEWFDLILNDNSVDAKEFENIFGNRHEKSYLELIPINENNIQNSIFSVPF